MTWQRKHAAINISQSISNAECIRCEMEEESHRKENESESERGSEGEREERGGEIRPIR